MKREWSDGEDRPEFYDGTTLTRAIEDYFSKPVDEEIARLKRENAEMRGTLGREKAATAKAGSRDL